MHLVAGAMGNLAPKLLRLLQDEYSLHKGVRKQIQSLSEELESVHGALRKVAAVPPDQLDEQVKIWARQVRDASYDMEDVLDTFLVRVDGRRPEQEQQPTGGGHGRLKGAVKRMGRLLKKAKAHRHIAGAIDGIKKQLQEVAERRARYGVDEAVVARPPASIDPRLAAMYAEVTQLVGMDGAMDELLLKLSLPLETEEEEVVANANHKLKIVSFLGVGGLGKSTLAKAVYDKLKSQFDCGAFVSVGRNPDLKKVFRDILIDLDKQRYMAQANSLLILDERHLIDELREFLGSKRYFIVIDDVWKTQTWETIRLALVENNRGSRIISTTRNSEVTNGGEVYRPRPLSHQNSKRLFYTRIFGRDGKFPDKQLDEVSDKILQKCGGIPLAIITMASLLVDKPRAEWSELCNSTGFRDKDIEQVDTTMWILSLSYYDLPCHLRTCLLYLSTFPEDYIVDKCSLIWKWIAEDFVHKKPGIWLFEVGEGYFNELVDRSMIQAVVSKHDGIIDGCRLHDMVLDLLRSLSLEENFVTVLDNVSDEGTLSVSRARRLSHQRSKIDAHWDNHKGMQKMRSFIAYRCHEGKKLSFLSFKLLRVLDLEAVYMECWHNAKHLGNLLHLRYLGLKGTNMPELPKEIEALMFLQTLDLVENFFMEELPSSIGQLTQLVCLRACGVPSMPNGVIKKLTSLEELLVECDIDELDNSQFNMNELGNLSELRVLTIRTIEMDQDMLSDLLKSVANLHKIQSLKLENQSNHCNGLYDATFHEVALPRHLKHLLVSEYCLRLSKLPSCIDPRCLVKLSHLELYVIDMDEQSMKTLGGLRELRHLVLNTESTVTLTNIATQGCFHKLRSCKFIYSMVFLALNDDCSVSFTLWNGRDDVVFGSRKEDEPRRAPPVMPNLEEISFEVHSEWCLRKCEDGSFGNLGLEYLTSLQKVIVSIECEGFFFEMDLTDTEAELIHAIDVHPNNPTLTWTLLNEDSLRSYTFGDTDDDLALEEQEYEAPFSSP